MRTPATLRRALWGRLAHAIAPCPASYAAASVGGAVVVWSGAARGGPLRRWREGAETPGAVGMPEDLQARPWSAERHVVFARRSGPQAWSSSRAVGGDARRTEAKKVVAVGTPRGVVLTEELWDRGESARSLAPMPLSFNKQEGKPPS